MFNRPEITDCERLTGLSGHTNRNGGARYRRPFCYGNTKSQGVVLG
jgi:hypothetical protein